MTIEVDGDVASRPQIITTPGKPVTVTSPGGGARPIHLQRTMTPIVVGESIALAGWLKGRVGGEVEHVGRHRRAGGAGGGDGSRV
ncbi:hypothetical protein DV096_02330 [Bradymonadaceae bacterium TMQ3]|nr:hypothetical protein DV096_02330 [Bradymonadaceae bacterium TMQ3]